LYALSNKKLTVKEGVKLSEQKDFQKGRQQQQQNQQNQQRKRMQMQQQRKKQQQ
jgi:hypothetical protein